MGYRQPPVRRLRRRLGWAWPSSWRRPERSWTPLACARHSGGRQARYGSNAILVSLAFAGILAVLTYLAITNTKQLDLTEDKQYTLTTETQLVLSGLKEPVEVIGFYTPDASASRDAIRPLLDQYRLIGGGKLTYRFVDPRPTRSRPTATG